MRLVPLPFSPTSSHTSSHKNHDHAFHKEHTKLSRRFLVYVLHTSMRRSAPPFSSFPPRPAFLILHQVVQVDSYPYSPLTKNHSQTRHQRRDNDSKRCRYLTRYGEVGAARCLSRHTERDFGGVGMHLLSSLPLQLGRLLLLLINILLRCVRSKCDAGKSIGKSFLPPDPRKVYPHIPPRSHPANRQRLSTSTLAGRTSATMLRDGISRLPKLRARHGGAARAAAGAPPDAGLSTLGGGGRHERVETSLQHEEDYQGRGCLVAGNG